MLVRRWFSGYTACNHCSLNLNSTLLDSIEKKIKVVSAVAEELGLKNVIPLRKRVEEEKGKYDFVISRAVTDFPNLLNSPEKI